MGAAVARGALVTHSWVLCHPCPLSCDQPPRRGCGIPCAAAAGSWGIRGGQGAPAAAAASLCGSGGTPAAPACPLHGTPRAGVPPPARAMSPVPGQASWHWRGAHRLQTLLGTDTILPASPRASAGGRSDLGTGCSSARAESCCVQVSPNQTGDLDPSGHSHAGARLPHCHPGDSPKGHPRSHCPTASAVTKLPVHSQRPTLCSATKLVPGISCGTCPPN